MCSRVWRAWRAGCSSRSSLVRGLERRQVGVERDLRVDDDQLAAGQAHEHVRAQRPLAGAGSCAARRSRSGRPCRPSRPRCAAGSRPRSRAWRGASARTTRLPVSWRSVPTPSPSWRTICASSPCACLRSRSRRPISLSILPSFSCTGAHEPLDLLGAARHLAAARSSSARRGRRAAAPSESPVCGEHVERDRLQLVAHALAIAPHEHGGAAAPSSTPRISKSTFIDRKR